MLDILTDYTPADLGFDPAEFPAFRRHPVTDREVQLEVLEFAAGCERRFAVACAPTGFGKSLVAVALAKLTGLRTAILSATKGVQNQYERFQRYGLTDIRGRTNYPCDDYPHLDCEHGSKVGCRLLRGKGCTYEIERDAARNSDIPSTNYAYWLAINDGKGGLMRRGEGVTPNPVELLVCDEIDEAVEILSGYVSVWLSEGMISRFGEVKKLGDGVAEWKSAVRPWLAELKGEIETTKLEVLHLTKTGKVEKKHVDVLVRLERLAEKLNRVAGMDDDWVIEKTEGGRWGRSWSFDVVSPGRYAERFLWCGVPKIVCLSATVTPMTMGLLGVGKDKYEYRSWEPIFPPNRCPIVLAPAKDGEGKSVRLSRRSSEGDIDRWVQWIDELIAARQDRKGLIITTSYSYAEKIMERSRHGDIMIGNDADPDSDSAAEVAERFYGMDAPRVLVSPSFGRGWDFNGERAEYLIVPKCPFVPLFSKVMKARLRRDRRYGDYLAMTTLRQAVGRVMRSEDDRGEVVLVDGQFEWWLYANRGLGGGLVERVRRVTDGGVKVPPKL